MHPHEPRWSPFRRCLRLATGVLLMLVLVLSCKRPETALRERPVQRVELVLAVAGSTPEEASSLLVQLADAFGVVDQSTPRFF